LNITSSNNLKSSFPSVAAVLFDGSYWNNVRKDIGASYIDLIKLSDELCQPAYRLRTYYFDGKDDHRQSFHDNLKSLSRFEVILGDVVEREISCPHCKKPFTTREQKRVDVQLAVQMVHLATSQQVNLIVLVAGDRDFVPSVEIAKHSGVIVRLVHGPRMTTSTDLRQLADETTEITESFLQRYLRESKIQKSKKRSIPSKSPSKSPIMKINKDKIEQSQSLLIKAVQNIPIAPDGGILASRLGIVMSDIEPDWKIHYGVKSLANLLELTDTNIVTLEKKGKLLTLYPNPDFIKKSKSVKKLTKQDQAISFLIKNLKELQKTKDNDMVRLSVLGLHLTKIEPDWKKKYKIKKLDQLVKLADNQVQTKGEGVDKRIGL
jgi:uncharacterized LabA/DUF88 family protein/mRNA-degrading endonuclease YafQ of YafQ-DinJ toxin-antitoxin module